MSDITLSRVEAEGEGGLPPVCMRCGAPADLILQTQFPIEWGNSRAYGSPEAALTVLAVEAVKDALGKNKRMTVGVPLCHRHRHHWFWHLILAGFLLGLFMLGGITCYTIALVATPGSSLWPAGTLPRTVIIGCAIGLLASIIFLMAVAPIQSRQITDNTITLTGVSPRFVQAVEQRRSEPGGNSVR